MMTIISFLKSFLELQKYSVELDKLLTKNPYIPFSLDQAIESIKNLKSSKETLVCNVEFMFPDNEIIKDSSNKNLIFNWLSETGKMFSQLLCKDLLVNSERMISMLSMVEKDQQLH